MCIIFVSAAATPYLDLQQSLHTVQHDGLHLRHFSLDLFLSFLPYQRT